MMQSLAAKVIQSFASLVYPSVCLHCKELMDPDFPLLCLCCMQFLELVDPQQRCMYCFSSDISSNSCCQACFKKKPSLRIASAFDYIGPAETLIKQMKYANLSYLAKGIGAFLAAQFMKLNWPTPDVVVPVPIALTKWIDRGFNQSELIAQEFAKILNLPVHNRIKRKAGEFSQAGLNHHQRIQLRQESFILKKGDALYDKKLLLIDDVTTTGSTLTACAEVLFTLYPKSIYGLTVCRAI